MGAAVFAVADEEVERVLVLGEEQKLLRRVGEEALVLENALQLGELRLDLPLFENAGLVDEPGQAGDFGPEGGRVDRGYHVFELGDDLLLLVFGKLVEVVWDPLLDLLLPVGFRVGQDLLAPIPHPFQGSPDGVDGRGHPALKHGHGEADGTSPGAVFGRGPN